MLAGACACGSGGGFSDAAAPPPLPPHPGTIAVAWSLSSASGATTTCTDAGATKVTVALADAMSGHFSATFDCVLGDAVTGALYPGTYDLGFSLENAVGAVATAAPQLGLMISADKTTIAAPVVFMVATP